MSSSNETKKPTGRPSLLSAEQQNALEKHQPTPVAPVPQAGAAPRRKHAWWVAGMGVLAVVAAFAVVQSGEAEQPATTLAAAPVAPPPATPPAAAQAVPAAIVDGAAPPAAGAPDTAAVGAAVPAVAAIVDEAAAPLQPDAKPKESLAQMLESGVPPAPKVVAAPKPVRKPVKQKSAKPSDRAVAAAPEQDTDVDLLAALVAHAKFDTSANARLSLPKALEQCKKQGRQDAARCRIRVCDGRWKKEECRVYSRSKLERASSGS